jgi:arylsulfatase A-like enzyme
MNNPSQKAVGTLLGFCAFALLPSLGFAQTTATYLGTQADMTGWRTSTVDKPFDPGGDDILGTEGYHLFGAAGENTTPPDAANGSLALLPGYITVTRNAPAEVQYAYAFIDNPVDGTPATILSGTTAGQGAGPTRIATVTFGATVPSDLIMTLMHDNLNGDFTVAGYELRASDGTSVLASVSSLSSNNQPDWHSFQISGLSGGDEVQVWGTSGGVRSTTLGALTFDPLSPSAPVALAQTVNTRVDTAASVTLTGIGSNLTYSVASQPSHGTLSGTEPNLTYTPSGGYIGSDSFTFTVSDGQSTSDPATVSIEVADIGPNFLLFLTDDQGYNDLGVQGSPHILTPQIDQLAAEGIRFTSGYVPSPVCGPCRAGLMTGSYPIRVAEPSNRKNYHTEPHTNEIFIPELLKTAGYTSAMIGKWHLSGGGTAASGFASGRGPIDQGFDYFYGTPSHNGLHAVDTGNVNTSVLRADSSGTTVVDNDLNQSEADQMILNYTEEAKDFITASHNAGQPFFLALTHNMPHVSLGARQSFRDSAAARGLDVYTAVVEELDWSMGEVLDKLDELGIADNTFVIFSSDNGPWTQAPPTGGNNLEGYYGSAFPLRGSKMRSLEGGPRVPFIVRWPGTVTPGVVSDEIVTLMDLFPTFMDYAGVEIPGNLEIDGRSIRPLIEGTDTVSPHDYYYYYCYTQLAAIRDTRWKLVLPRRDNPDSAWMSFWRTWQDRVDEVELYDLDKDPEETTNVAPWHPEVVKRLLEQVEVARAELGDKDRIGSGARFFDGSSPRPDIAAYNNSASTQPYVDEPLTGLPSAVRTGADTALVTYDEPGTYSSVELVWAHEDQGQQAASVWAAAEGGGSANLGAKSPGDPIEHEITGLDPFGEYVYRFILTDAGGSLWSIPAVIDPQQYKVIVQQIGIDFSDGGNTGGSGSEPNWNIINGDGNTATVRDSRTGNVLPGVSIQTTGASGGEMAESDLGFGVADYGNYLDTPFSDLSANDGVWGAPGTIQVVVSGLNDAYSYEVEVIPLPAVSTGLTDLTVTAGGQSEVRTYASFRPYINNDPPPYTNSDWVLSSPFYSRPILVPSSFENLNTDGSGNLAITLSDDQAMALSAIHITATSSSGETAFGTWSTSGGASGVTFEGDANGDGVPDGIAFLLGAATPGIYATRLLPVVSESGGDLSITFNCLPMADRGDAELRVEHSSDLGISDPWLATVDEVPDADDPVADNGVTFVVDTISAAPLNKITATVSSAEASDGRLFVRLQGIDHSNP